MLNEGLGTNGFDWGTSAERFESTAERLKMKNERFTSGIERFILCINYSILLSWCPTKRHVDIWCTMA